jgi:hypothetical protein
MVMRMFFRLRLGWVIPLAPLERGIGELEGVGVIIPFELGDVVCIRPFRLPLFQGGWGDRIFVRSYNLQNASKINLILDAA